MLEVASPSVAQLLEQLDSGLVGLEEECSWRRYLRAQSRFHRYSSTNALLILSQLPTATSVAGVITWRSLGRFVRRGERAIWIVAPVTGRRGDERDERAVGFRRVAVFDVSQTEGAALASACRPLEGETSPLLYSSLERVATTLGFRVERSRLEDGHYGDCTYAKKRIRVSTAASPAQAVKTLAHELAHALLHDGEPNRALAELEAESVAYVVCQHVGLDSGAYSFGYLASWAGGSTAARQAIKASCGRIAKTASRMIAALDEGH